MNAPIDLGRQVAAEALFGSAARGDDDALSDRDFLIVDDDPVVLTSRMRELEATGASVASYTFAKLNALAARGALFVQHLKLESIILRDRHGRLARLLGNFTPKADYSLEIAENACLASLAGTVPNGPRGVLLAADILYVAVRNYGVLSLASRGIHAYAFDKVIASLDEQGLIVANGSRALGALRFLKCLYRSGESGSGRAASEAVDDALASLPSNFFPRQVRGVCPSDIIAAAAPPRTAPPYVVLRDLERRLLALQTLGHVPAVDGDLAQLSAWIANPRAYAMMSHRVAPRIRETIARAATVQGRSRIFAMK